MPLFQRNTSNTSLFRVFLATTYVKLQDAYVSEANAVGSWKLIGYVSPGATSASTEGATTNFGYLAANPAAAGETAAISTFSSATKVWGARNLVALNDCAAQADAAIDAANWTISITGNSNGNSVSYTAATSCAQLTPTFDKIGK